MQTAAAAATSLYSDECGEPAASISVFDVSQLKAIVTFSRQIKKSGTVNKGGRVEGGKRVALKHLATQ